MSVLLNNAGFCQDAFFCKNVRNTTHVVIVYTITSFCQIRK